MSKLKNENNILAEFKAKCDGLENDKRKLQKLVVDYESSRPADVDNEKCDATKSGWENLISINLRSIVMTALIIIIINHLSMFQKPIRYWRKKTGR